jgi:hypothetical protein
VVLGLEMGAGEAVSAGVAEPGSVGVALGSAGAVTDAYSPVAGTTTVRRLIGSASAKLTFRVIASPGSTTRSLMTADGSEPDPNLTVSPAAISFEPAKSTVPASLSTAVISSDWAPRLTTAISTIPLLPSSGATTRADRTRRSPDPAWMPSPGA